MDRSFPVSGLVPLAGGRQVEAEGDDEGLTTGGFKRLAPVAPWSSALPGAPAEEFACTRAVRDRIELMVVEWCGR